RTNVVVSYHNGSSGLRKLALDNELARSYRDAMRALQKDLDAPGEITIGAILQAPGVMRAPEEAIDSNAAWPAVERALRVALTERGTPPCAGRPSSPPERACRSHVGVHHSGNFPRTEYTRSQGERCRDFATSRRLQSGAGKNPRTNSKP